MDAIEDCIKDVAAFEVMLGHFIVHNDLTSKLDLQKAFQLSCKLWWGNEYERVYLFGVDVVY